jgi:hypothetical protein
MSSILIVVLLIVLLGGGGGYYGYNRYGAGGLGGVLGLVLLGASFIISGVEQLKNDINMLALIFVIQ